MGVVTWKIWQRPRREAIWGIVAFALFFVLFDTLLISNISADSSLLDKAVPVVVIFVYVMCGVTLLYRVLVHAKLVANEQGVRIANPFRDDQLLAWSEITSMRADRLLMIRCVDSRQTVAWVIQKNGWARYRQIRTDADEVIDELSALANRALKTDSINFANPAGASH